MTELERIVVGESAVPSLILTVVLLLAIPVGFFLCWRRKQKQQTNISYLIAGAVGFLVTVRMLELGVHYFCILADNPVSRFLNGSTAAYVLYGALTAGVFEECGRHIVLKYVMKKHRTRENAVLYGIGHGGIEILAVLLPTVLTYLAVAAAFSGGDAESARIALNITEESAAAALPTVRAAAAFDYATAAMNVTERLLAMLLHIGLSVVVYDGVVNKKKSRLPAAVLLHMLTDVFPALYQRGALPLWSVEVWTAVWTAAVVLIARTLYTRMQ